MSLNFSTFKRTCSEDDCGLEAAPRLQRCYECWLARKPPVVRCEAAERRLALIPESARRATVPAKEWPPGRRWCAGCQTFVRLKDSSGSRCKACASIANHAGRAKATFGIDPESYQWLLKAQHGKCAICRQKPKTTRLAIDHWHNHCKSGCSKCIRGLLCSRCNHDLLGSAHDSIEILRNAVVYLERPPAAGEWTIPDYEADEWRRQNPDDPDHPAPF